MQSKVRTAAKNKNSHDTSGLPRVEANQVRGRQRDYFIDLGVVLRLESASTVEQTPETLVVDADTFLLLDRRVRGTRLVRMRETPVFGAAAL